MTILEEDFGNLHLDSPGGADMVIHILVWLIQQESKIQLKINQLEFRSTQVV